MSRKIISTTRAPEALGPYSQAVMHSGTLFVSGQIGLNPRTALMAEGIEAQAIQVIDNLEAVIQTAGGSLADIVKLTVYLTDLIHFQLINQIMKQRFTEPYPARAAIGVAALPKDALVEIDAIAFIDQD
ncbi:MAG: RidA family protein [Gammaproteobacteria bacterium AqS3]|nr:RidA family protein [Gammaproteobacteria bacterium AqS3]